MTIAAVIIAVLLIAIVLLQSGKAESDSQIIIFYFSLRYFTIISSSFTLDIGIFIYSVSLSL